jgi:hypothetical protein
MIKKPIEITKCTIFEQNRHIACQTQEKKPKNVLVWQVMTLKKVGENHAFCKKLWLDS